MNRLVRIARIARRRSSQRVVTVLALRDKTIVAHIIHAREQVAFLLVALRERHPVRHGERLQQVTARKVTVAELVTFLFHRDLSLFPRFLIKNLSRIYFARSSRPTIIKNFSASSSVCKAISTVFPFFPGISNRV